MSRCKPQKRRYDKIHEWTEILIYHVGNVQEVVRIQIVLRRITNSLQDRQNGRTDGQVVMGQFRVRAVPTLQVSPCSIFVDLHTSQGASGGGVYQRPIYE
ncbi:hypothetical protein TNCV_2358471 [Trichonephila clavipes]|nr:hypothetical protein TNCV_2358471 [Trichonephila clavipes]